MQAAPHHFRATRILTVDDHPMLRDGLSAIIALQPDMEVVGEAEDGRRAVEQFRDLKPDVTLMDLQMPEMNGVAAITAIRSEFPAARIIVLTTYSGDFQAVRALKAGAVGYLLKSSLRKELLAAIRTVHAGRKYIPATIANEIAVHAGSDVLTEREVSVLRLVGAGNTNKQIAGQLAISEDTVKAHVKNIFVKLEVNDRAHAVMVAVRRGMLDL